MKVEPLNDIQRLQHLGPPKVSLDPAPAASQGSDGLANTFSQEVESNGKTLSSRSMGARVTSKEQIAQLYDQLGHPAQATLASIARRVRQHLVLQPSVESLVDVTGSDPARTFLVLKHVAAQAQAEARTVEAALARDAIARLELRFKREIQAGLNIATALQAASEDPHERQQIRALYYASVVARQSLATMMQTLLGMYGGEQFANGLKLMRRALADDIAAHAPSLPTAQLRTLLLGLQSCGHLSGVLAECVGVVQRLSAEEAPVMLLQRLLGYAVSGVATADVQCLADDFGGSQASRQLVSLNALYPLVRQLPLVVWRDSRERQEALNCFLLVMGEFARTERGPLGFAGVAK
jgi:type III secretion protein W